MSRTHNPLLPLLFLAAWQGGDGSDKTSTATIVEHPNGMRSVSYNAVEPEPHDWLVEDLRIGTASGSPDETFGEIRAFGIDSDGNVYVLDAQAQDVRVFDPSGSYLCRIVQVNPATQQASAPGRDCRLVGERSQQNTVDWMLAMPSSRIRIVQWSQRVCSRQ